MALTLSGTNGVVGAGFTVDASGVSVTAGVGTFSSIGAGASVPAAGLTGSLPTISAASLTSIPAANIVGVCTSGLTKTGGFGSRTISSSTTLSSQSEVDYTGFGVITRFDIQCNALSYSGDTNFGIRLGTGGSVDTSGYLAQGGYFGLSASSSLGQIAQTTGFFSYGLASASYSINGIFRFFRVDATQHKWYCRADLAIYANAYYWFYINGYRTLSGELDIIRVLPESGNFDAGNLRLVTYTD